MPEALVQDSHTPNIKRVLGPLLVGTILNALIYGICVTQFWTYCTSRTEKRRRINFLVNWVFLLDTFHTLSICSMLWKYAVENFDDPSYLTNVEWPFAMTPIITTLTSLPIQIYLSWRIRIFSGSTRVFVFLASLATIQTVLGFVCSIMAFLVANISHFQQLIPFVDAWQVMAMACDVSITLLLAWYLNKSRTGSQSCISYSIAMINAHLIYPLESDHIITRVIKSSVETAAFGAFFCVMDLVTFTALPNNNFHVIFALPLGRIYTNTLLMTLNSRESLREEWERPQILDIQIQDTYNSHRAANRTRLRTSDGTGQTNLLSMTDNSSLPHQTAHSDDSGTAQASLTQVHESEGD